MEIKIADEDDDQKPRPDRAPEETPADAEREEFEQDMKLARQIMRDNRKALRALADAPPAGDEPL